MLAIAISRGLEPIAKNPDCKTLTRLNQSQFIFSLLVILALLFPGVPALSAADPHSTNEPMRTLDFAVRAKKIYLEARKQFQSGTNNPTAAWKYARACFELGEFATSNSDRAEIAEIGIAVAKELSVREPQLAEAHYYLAMNLGQLARTKSLGALRLVGQMETAFLAARRLNQTFDNAGPDRNLGTLYLEAPAFGSIGSRSKARQHLRRAVELAPDYPENRLILTEAYARWGENVLAAREFRILANAWEAAHQKFAGEQWGSNWIDWEKRFSVLKAKLGDIPAQIESPRH
jgi:tetratricopeptide (TPR) repeat protein